MKNHIYPFFCLRGLAFLSPLPAYWFCSGGTLLVCAKGSVSLYVLDQAGAAGITHRSADTDVLYAFSVGECAYTVVSCQSAQPPIQIGEEREETHPTCLRLGC